MKGERLCVVVQFLRHILLGSKGHEQCILYPKASDAYRSIDASAQVSRQSVSTSLLIEWLTSRKAISPAITMNQRQPATRSRSSASNQNGLNTNLFNSSNHKSSAMSYLVILLINLCLIAEATSSKFAYLLWHCFALLDFIRANFQQDHRTSSVLQDSWIES